MSKVIECVWCFCTADLREEDGEYFCPDHWDERQKVLMENDHINERDKVLEERRMR